MCFFKNSRKESLKIHQFSLKFGPLCHHNLCVCTKVIPLSLNIRIQKYKQVIHNTWDSTCCIAVPQIASTWMRLNFFFFIDVNNLIITAFIGIQYYIDFVGNFFLYCCVFSKKSWKTDLKGSLLVHGRMFLSSDHNRLLIRVSFSPHLKKKDRKHD